MTIPPKQSAPRLPLPGLLGLVVIAVGILALAGWLWGLPVLQDVFTGQEALNPATALGLALCGVSLTLLGPRDQGPAPRLAGQGCAVLAGLIGALWFAGEWLEWPVRVDQLLFAAQVQGAPDGVACRMAPQSALTLLCTAAALLLLEYQTRGGFRPAEGLALVSAFSSLLVIAGYTYSALSLPAAPEHTPMALHAAGASFLLANGLLAARPDRGLVAALMAPGEGGASMRRLMAAVLVFPLVIGGLILGGRSWERYETPLGFAFFAVTCIAVFGMLVWATAQRLNAVDAERSRAERALCEDRNLYRMLLDTMPDFIWIKDGDGRFVLNNAAHLRVLGAPQESVEGKTDFDFFPTDLAGRYHADEEEILRTGCPLINREEPVPGRDGGPRWYITSKVPFQDGSGKVAGVVGISRDITAQKEAQEELEAAKEAAEAANRAKGDFLANVSHEIRTPMNGIMGMTELALDTELNPEQREYLSLVQFSAEALLVIINDLLDFAKMEAGKMELEYLPFSLRESVGDTMKTLAVRAHQKGLELAFQVETGVPDGLVGDAGRLRQVLLNLVGNAVKFTPIGEVVVQVARIAEDAMPGNGVTLHFSVSDTGIGIPEDKLDTMFQAFTQADSSTTRKYGGTGLGLAISSTLVQLMGGRIWAESREGLGSTFHFTARFEAPPEAVTAAAPLLARVKGLPVLLVDDNASHRRILAELLASWQMRPATAAAGAEALDLLRQRWAAGNPFAVVLLDAQMPGMDGFALAAELQQHPELAVPVVMMLSAAGRPGDPDRSRAVGVSAFVTKPVKPSELWDSIAGALSQELDADTPSFPAEQRAGNAPHAGALRILLAEDNPINRKLAVRLLERRGHSVRVAADGREAVEAARRERFDVALMDIQMPEMSGLEATLKIRAQEAQDESRRLPIIAVTAHAMSGDREACLAAGMDGYVSKPLHPDELFAEIVHLLGTGAAGLVPVTGPAVPPGPAVLDRAALLRYVEGDAHLLVEVLALFRAEAPRLSAELRQALDAGRPAEVSRTAHRLKGVAASLHAAALKEAAEQLERLARADNIQMVEPALAALETELARLEPALAAFVAEAQP